ncbi:glycoside hydrolase family 43 protein [Sphingobacterium sp. lm-10]|uniref:glycoside hydrolase family 43 protein n=1 Tax=Sphingobacterium sp. lm-10 TaxID=2944904 RepID=UPI002020EB73|nr:glycoside hydrolase family 43 protein [Sphingobacterium sp. lm-10]MCL7987122.1 glycoside hydrolase family 43 protein [Sphingobacterium sp. lm-10]
MMKNLFYIVFLVISLSCDKRGAGPFLATPKAPEATGPAKFQNPLLTAAPDPWVAQRGDFYYFLQTLGNRIEIRKTAKMSELASSTSQVVFNAPSTGSNSRDVWAPELFFLRGKWYIYYTASNGQDVNHRMFVLENANEDPTTNSWVDKGQLITQPTDQWAIDGSIFEQGDDLFFIWSGRPGAQQGNLTQNIYISKMSDPFTLVGETMMISAPELDWERRGFSVNEGPEILKNPAGEVFLIYSASYCGTDDYSLGMLKLTAAADPMKKASWSKHPNPVFSKAPTAYGAGHNGFFKSKDGTEDWIIYHANSESHPNNDGCGNVRSTRMQKFTWNSDGTPNFGQPVAAGAQLEVPAGE